MKIVWFKGKYCSQPGCYYLVCCGDCLLTADLPNH